MQPREYVRIAERLLTICPVLYLLISNCLFIKIYFTLNRVPVYGENIAAEIASPFFIQVCTYALFGSFMSVIFWFFLVAFSVLASHSWKVADRMAFCVILASISVFWIENYIPVFRRFGEWILD